MKTIISLIGIIFVLLLIIFGFDRLTGTPRQVTSYNVDDPNAPKVEIQEKKYDFGIINLQDVVKYEFKIKNVGKSPLVITDLLTSCHCTTVVLKVPGKEDSPTFGMHSQGFWQGEIPKDTEATLAVTYEPAKHPSRGQVNRVITFISNDPASKEVQLELSGEVL